MKLYPTYRPHAISILLLFASCKEKEAWVRPLMSPITEAIFAAGHIEPDRQVVLTSVNEGYLQQAFVKENDVVTKGALLFAIDNRSSRIEEEASEKNLRLAMENASPNSPVLQKLKTDLHSARQKASLDSVQYARMRQLYETNSVAKVDLDNMRLVYDTDKNAINAIQKSIEATGISLQQALVAAQSQHKSSVSLNQYFFLRSPGQVRVYQVFKKSGEFVRRGDALALLGDPDSLLIVLQVDEVSISKIKPGQQVLVELNTSKGKYYEGCVARIFPYFDSETQSYKVEAVLDTHIEGIIAGTLLQANIIVASKEKAMLIPRSCLIDDGTVLVKKEGESDTTFIQTGIVSNEWVEVLSGLQLTDHIVKHN